MYISVFVITQRWFLIYCLKSHTDVTVSSCLNKIKKLSTSLKGRGKDLYINAFFFFFKHDCDQYANFNCLVSISLQTKIPYFVTVGMFLKKMTRSNKR